MADPKDILDLAGKKLEPGKLVEYTFECKDGEGIEKCDFQFRFDNYTLSQCQLKGLDPASSRQFFCHGKIYTDDHRTFDVVLNISTGGFELKMLESSWDASSAAYLNYRLPTTGAVLKELFNVLKEID
ncbi:MAG: hypothetical protein COV46_06560 [Deltaproteobacteria bacterium CG11_big_fil_rev_8_21_14_0_20_49_13]|nr:MAG: hypothetical protein COV46_06560 [Deltaproteobacteria bacterium CG11_big_fil_rev_8_21_14_0_20_49_13]